MASKKHQADSVQHGGSSTHGRGLLLPPSVATYLPSCSPRFVKQIGDISHRLSVRLLSVQIGAVHKLLSVALDGSHHGKFPANLRASVALLFHILRSPVGGESLSSSQLAFRSGSPVSAASVLQNDYRDAGLLGDGGGGGGGLQQLAFLHPHTISTEASMSSSSATSPPFVLYNSGYSSTSSGGLWEGRGGGGGGYVGVAASASEGCAVSALRAAALRALLRLVYTGILDLHTVVDEVLATVASSQVTSAQDGLSGDGMNRQKLAEDSGIHRTPPLETHGRRSGRIDFSLSFPEGLQRLLFTSLVSAALQGKLAGVQTGGCGGEAKESRLTRGGEGGGREEWLTRTSESQEKSSGLRDRPETNSHPSSAPSSSSSPSPALHASAALVGSVLQRFVAFDCQVANVVLEPLCDALLVLVVSRTDSDRERWRQKLVEEEREHGKLGEDSKLGRAQGGETSTDDRMRETQQTLFVKGNHEISLQEEADGFLRREPGTGGGVTKEGRRVSPFPSSVQSVSDESFGFVGGSEREDEYALQLLNISPASSSLKATCYHPDDVLRSFLLPLLRFAVQSCSGPQARSLALKKVLDTAAACFVSASRKEKNSPGSFPGRCPSLSSSMRQERTVEEEKRELCLEAKEDEDLHHDQRVHDVVEFLLDLTIKDMLYPIEDTSLFLSCYDSTKQVLDFFKVRTRRGRREAIFGRRLSLQLVNLSLVLLQRICRVRSRGRDAVVPLLRRCLYIVRDDALFFSSTDGREHIHEKLWSLRVYCTAVGWLLWQGGGGEGGLGDEGAIDTDDELHLLLKVAYHLLGRLNSVVRCRGGGGFCGSNRHRTHGGSHHAQEANLFEASRESSAHCSKGEDSNGVPAVPEAPLREREDQCSACAGLEDENHSSPSCGPDVARRLQSLERVVRGFSCFSSYLVLFSPLVALEQTLPKESDGASSSSSSSFLSELIASLQYGLKDILYTAAHIEKQLLLHNSHGARKMPLSHPADARMAFPIHSVSTPAPSSAAILPPSNDHTAPSKEIPWSSPSPSPSSRCSSSRKDSQPSHHRNSALGQRPPSPGTPLLSESPLSPEAHSEASPSALPASECARIDSAAHGQQTRKEDDHTCLFPTLEQAIDHLLLSHAPFFDHLHCRGRGAVESGGGEQGEEGFISRPVGICRAFDGQLLPCATIALSLFETIDLYLIRKLFSFLSSTISIASFSSSSSPFSVSARPPRRCPSPAPGGCPPGGTEGNGGKGEREKTRDRSVRLSSSSLHSSLPSCFLSGSPPSLSLSSLLPPLLLLSRNEGIASLFVCVLLLSESYGHRVQACKAIMLLLHVDPLEAQRALPLLHFSATHLPSLLARWHLVQRKRQTRRGLEERADRKKALQKYLPASTILGAPLPRSSTRTPSQDHHLRVEGAYHRQQRQSWIIRGFLSSSKTSLPSFFLPSPSPGGVLHSGRHHLGTEPKKNGHTRPQEGDPDDEQPFLFICQLQRLVFLHIIGYTIASLPADKIFIPPVYRALLNICGYDDSGAAHSPPGGFPPQSRLSVCSTQHASQARSPASSSSASASSSSALLDAGRLGDSSSRPCSTYGDELLLSEVPIWGSLSLAVFTPATRACLLQSLLTRLFLLGDLPSSKLQIASPSSSSSSRSSHPLSLFTYCCPSPTAEEIPPSSSSFLSAPLSIASRSPGIPNREASPCRQNLLASSMLLCFRDIARGGRGFTCSAVASSFLQQYLPQLQNDFLHDDDEEIRSQAVELLACFCACGVLYADKVKLLIEKKHRHFLNFLHQPPPVALAIAVFYHVYAEGLAAAVVSQEEGREENHSRSQHGDECNPQKGSLDARGGPEEAGPQQASRAVGARKLGSSLSGIGGKTEEKMIETLSVFEDLCQLGGCPRTRNIAFRGASLLLPHIYDAERSQWAAPNDSSLGGLAPNLNRASGVNQQNLQVSSSCPSSDSSGALADPPSCLPVPPPSRFLTSEGLTSLFLLPLDLPSVAGAACALGAAMKKERELIGRRKATKEGSPHIKRALRNVLRILHERECEDDTQEPSLKQYGRSTSGCSTDDQKLTTTAAEVGSLKADGRRGTPGGLTGSKRGGGGRDAQHAIIHMALFGDDLDRLIAQKPSSGSGSSTGPTAEKLHADKRRSAFVAQVKEASSSSRLQHPLLLSLQPQIWKELLHEYLASVPTTGSDAHPSRSEGGERGRGGGLSRCFPEGGDVGRELQNLFEMIRPVVLSSASKNSTERPLEYPALSAFLAALGLTCPSLAFPVVDTLKKCLFSPSIQQHTHEVPEGLVNGTLFALAYLHKNTIAIEDFFPLCSYLLKSSLSPSIHSCVYIAASSHVYAHPTDKVELFRLLQFYLDQDDDLLPKSRSVTDASPPTSSKRRETGDEEGADFFIVKKDTGGGAGRGQAGDDRQDVDETKGRKASSFFLTGNLRQSSSLGGVGDRDRDGNSKDLERWMMEIERKGGHEDKTDSQYIHELLEAIEALSLQELPYGWYIGIGEVSRLLYLYTPDPALYYPLLYSLYIRLRSSLFGFCASQQDSASLHSHGSSAKEETKASKTAASSHTSPLSSTMAAAPQSSFSPSSRGVSSFSRSASSVPLALIPLSTLVALLYEGGLLSARDVLEFLEALRSSMGVVLPSTGDVGGGQGAGGSHSLAWVGLAHLVSSLFPVLLSRHHPRTSQESLTFSTYGTFADCHASSSGDQSAMEDSDSGEKIYRGEGVSGVDENKERTSDCGWKKEKGSFLLKRDLQVYGQIVNVLSALHGQLSVWLKTSSCSSSDRVPRYLALSALHSGVSPRTLMNESCTKRGYTGLTSLLYEGKGGGGGGEQEEERMASDKRHGVRTPTLLACLQHEERRLMRLREEVEGMKQRRDTGRVGGDREGGESLVEAKSQYVSREKKSSMDCTSSLLSLQQEDNDGWRDTTDQGREGHAGGGGGGGAGSSLSALEQYVHDLTSIGKPPAIVRVSSVMKSKKNFDTLESERSAPADLDGTFMLCHLYVHLKRALRGEGQDHEELLAEEHEEEEEGNLGSSAYGRLSILPNHSFLRFAIEEIREASKASELLPLLQLKTLARDYSSANWSESSLFSSPSDLSVAGPPSLPAPSPPSPSPSVPSQHYFSPSSPSPSLEDSIRKESRNRKKTEVSVAIEPSPNPKQLHRTKAESKLCLSHLICLLEALSRVEPALPDVGLHACLRRLWDLSVRRLQQVKVLETRWRLERRKWRKESQPRPRQTKDSPGEVEGEEERRSSSVIADDPFEKSELSTGPETKQEDDEENETVPRGRDKWREDLRNHHDTTAAACFSLQISILKCCVAHACNSPLLAQNAKRWGLNHFLAVKEEESFSPSASLVSAKLRADVERARYVERDGTQNLYGATSDGGSAFSYSCPSCTDTPHCPHLALSDRRDVSSQECRHVISPKDLRTFRREDQSEKATSRRTPAITQRGWSLVPHHTHGKQQGDIMAWPRAVKLLYLSFLPSIVRCLSQRDSLLLISHIFSRGLAPSSTQAEDGEEDPAMWCAALFALKRVLIHLVSSTTVSRSLPLKKGRSAGGKGGGGEGGGKEEVRRPRGDFDYQDERTVLLLTQVEQLLTQWVLQRITGGPRCLPGQLGSRVSGSRSRGCTARPAQEVTREAPAETRERLEMREGEEEEEEEENSPDDRRRVSFCVLAHFAEVMETLLSSKRRRQSRSWRKGSSLHAMSDGKGNESEGGVRSSTTTTTSSRSSYAHEEWILPKPVLYQLPVLVTGYLVLKGQLHIDALRCVRDRLLLLLLPSASSALSLSSSSARETRNSPRALRGSSYTHATDGNDKAGRAVDEMGRHSAMKDKSVMKRERGEVGSSTEEGDLIALAFITSLLPWPQQLEAVRSIICSLHFSPVDVHRVLVLLVALSLYIAYPHLGALLLDVFLVSKEETMQRYHPATAWNSKKGENFPQRKGLVDKGHLCGQEKDGDASSLPEFVTTCSSSRDYFDSNYPFTGSDRDDEVWGGEGEAQLREPECLYSSITGIQWLLRRTPLGRHRKSRRGRSGGADLQDLREDAGVTGSRQLHPRFAFSSRGVCSLPETDRSARIELQLTVEPEGDRGLIPSFLQVLPLAFLNFRLFFSLHFLPNLFYWPSLLPRNPLVVPDTKHSHSQAPLESSSNSIQPFSYLPGDASGHLCRSMTSAASPEAVAALGGQQNVAFLMRKREKAFLQSRIPGVFLRFFNALSQLARSTEEEAEVERLRMLLQSYTHGKEEKGEEEDGRDSSRTAGSTRAVAAHPDSREQEATEQRSSISVVSTYKFEESKKTREDEEVSVCPGDNDVCEERSSTTSTVWAVIQSVAPFALTQLRNLLMHAHAVQGRPGGGRGGGPDTTRHAPEGRDRTSLRDDGDSLTGRVDVGLLITSLDQFLSSPVVCSALNGSWPPS